MPLKNSSLKQVVSLANILDKIEDLKFERNPDTSDENNIRVDIVFGNNQRLSEVYTVPTDIGFTGAQIDTFNNTINTGYVSGIGPAADIIENKIKEILETIFPDIFTP